MVYTNPSFSSVTHYRSNRSHGSPYHHRSHGPPGAQVTRSSLVRSIGLIRSNDCPFPMDISFESTRRVLYCRSSEPNGGGWMSGTVSIVWLRKKVCLVDPLGCLFG